MNGVWRNALRHRQAVVAAALAALVLLYGLGFGWLTAERHATLRTNAEDLGFTDQVVWNFLRGQAFRFSMYERAEWETDVDIAALRRPDSLLAFHVEPILVLFAPLYLVAPDVRILLWLQAILVALGAIPAYRFAHRRLGSRWAGLAFAAAYLLAPLGQWALYADFHTVALAAPLLMLAIDALDARRWRSFLLAGLLATATKEEIGLVFAGLGLLAVLGAVGGKADAQHGSGDGPIRWWRDGGRRAGLAAIILGAGWSLLCVGVIIPFYSGGSVSPFTARYAHLGGSPGAALLALFQNPGAYLEALTRPEVRGYLTVLLLSGGWLALLAPELLMPVGIVLALNVFSSSPWMASGRAHYSASLLPFLIAAAVVGAARLTRRGGVSPPVARVGQIPPLRRAFVPILSTLLLAGAALGYHRAGLGPLADGFVVPTRLPRHELAAQFAAAVPRDAPVSASTTLLPHVSQRVSVYLFPTLRDADYVLVDVAGDAFPISPGGIHLRVQELLASGEFRPLAAEDGLLLLEREAAQRRPLPERFYDFVRRAPGHDPAPVAERDAVPLRDGTVGLSDAALQLLSSELVPSGDSGPLGPLATLQTTWTIKNEPIDRPRPTLDVYLKDGTRQRFFDLPTIWWYPPEQWRPGELIRIDVPGLPLREVNRWEAHVATEPRPALAESPAMPPIPILESTPIAEPTPTAEPNPSAEATAAPQPDATEIRLGELTARVEHDPWRLALLDPTGRPFWQPMADSDEGPAGPFGYRDAAGNSWRLTALLDVVQTPAATRLLAATDEPNGRTVSIELSSVGPRAVRISLEPSSRAWIAAFRGALALRPDERLLGFGERFDGVNQRGRMVRTWAQDRRDVDFGDATYAPIPFYISSRGYSLLVESDARGFVDAGKTRADRLIWEVQQPAVSLVLSYGPAPRELVQQQASLTGLPPLPPIWAFGVWKTAIGGQDQVLRDAIQLREQRLPVSGLFVYDAADEASLLGWPHVGYARARAGRYPDLRAMNDRLHEQGFKSLGYKNADLSARRPGESAAARSGVAVRAPDGSPYLHPHHLVSWVDFTNPEALAWWGGLWRRILGDLGFDGAMLDLGEVVPEDAQYADGTSGIETHNRYLGLYAKASFEAARAVRGNDFALFTRSGSLGAQRYQSLQWSGDQTITWDQDGLRGLVPAALSFGLSGFPYWHPEVGGYLSTGLPRATERELWFRWLQLGALSPLLRDHYGEHRGNPVEVWSDGETLDQFRRYARLHNSLVPYLYSQARVASETGLPIIRHLALTAPDDPRAWAEEYCYTLGDDLLVAPVVEEGARTRAVYLPAGEWVDWWTGQLRPGGDVVTVEAPLHRIPLFARAGAILPLAPDFQTLAPTTDPNVATWNGDLVVRVVGPTPAAEEGWVLPSASQRLYDGTLLRTSVDRGAIKLEATSATVERSWELQLPAAAPPGQVTLNGAPLDGWSWRDGSVSLTFRAASFSVAMRP
ncbi:MAG: DUF2079 domain-containing protein [Chloroflexi bacterium]|nr:DUF2079 domain-containing protein [Chloroflexota bacterium]